MSRLGRIRTSVAVVIAIAVAAPASAATGDLKLQGCLGSLTGCTPTTPATALDAANGVAVSPDGRHLYAVAAGAAGAISRMTAGDDGAPAYDGCYGNDKGCVAVPTNVLGGATAVVLTPDGHHLYVGSDLGVAHFAVNADGTLTYKSCVGSGTSCTAPSPAGALDSAYGLAVSPSGQHLYVTTRQYAATFPYDVVSGAVSHVLLATDGTPTFTGCVGNLAGCTATTPASALLGARGVTVARDGSHVYVGADPALSYLAVGATGSLTFSGCMGSLKGCAVPSLATAVDDAHALAISADGHHLFAGAQAVSQLTLSAAGVPTFAGCTGNLTGCTATTPANALTNATAVVPAPVTGGVYVAAGDVVSHLAVNSDGSLAFRGCIGALAPCSATLPGAALNGAAGLALASAGGALYAAANGSGTVSHLHVELPPAPPTTTAPPPPTATTPAPPPAPPATNPAVASLSLATATPRAGAPVVLSGTGSTACSSTRARRSARASGGAGPGITSYLWDFDGDNHIDANTGSIPSAQFVFADPGSHTVGLQVVDNAGCSSALTRISLGVAGPPAGCTTHLQRGRFDIAASCIREPDPGRFEISLDSPVLVNGLTFEASHTGRHLFLDTRGRRSRGFRSDTPLGDTTREGWVFSSDEPVVKVSMDDTPAGKITLGERNLENQPVTVENGANSDDDDAPGLRLFSIRADRNCGAREREVCAQLPGGFPLTGMIGVYLSSDAPGGSRLPGIVVDANLALERPLSITGHVALTGDLSEGIQFDSFGFRTQNIDFGVGRIDQLGLSYERQDDQTGDLDVWTGNAQATLRTPTPVRVAGEVRFANGGFQRARLDLQGFRVPVGPGIFLTGFGGELGANPFSIGGSLSGAVGPIDLRAGFLYRDAYHGAPSSFHLDAQASIFAFVRADGTLDISSDGFVGAGVNVHAGFPSVDDPRAAQIDGYVRGWTFNGQFQISGGVHVTVASAFGGEVQGFVNNDWAAGCGSVHAGVFEPSGWARGRLDGTGNIEWGLGGCDNIAPYCRAAPPGHDAPACLGFSARPRMSLRSTGPQQVQVRPGMQAANLKVTSATGVPQVRISGPSGAFTTSADGATSGQGAYLATAVAMQHELVVTILEPKPGVYAVAPVDGSPAVTGVLEADVLPDSHIQTRVVGHGRVRTLQWSMRPIPGQRVRFTERGRDVARIIGTARTARGSLRFAVATGNARARTIEATPYLYGMPQRPRTVGRYTAPARPRPGLPGRVRLRSAGNAVTATWGAARQADAYRVLVTAADGRRDVLRVPAKRRTVRVDRVFPGMSVRVAVRGALGAAETTGPERVATLQRKA